MKIKEIREKSEKELEKFVTDNKTKVLKTKFQIASRETNNHQEVRRARKNIAKALTVKREKELAVQDKTKETK